MIRILLFAIFVVSYPAISCSTQTESTQKNAEAARQDAAKENEQAKVDAKSKSADDDKKTGEATPGQAAAAAAANAQADQYNGEPIEEAVWPELKTESGLNVESVGGKLDQPFALAIHPQSNEVYVAESGKGRVVKVVGKTKTTIVEGFEPSTFSLGSQYQVGPLGIGFLDQNHLVVAGRLSGESQSLLSIYQLPAKGKKPVAADKPTTSHSVKPLDESAEIGAGYGLLTTGEGVYVTTNFESAKGWLLHADKIGTKLSNLKRFVSTTEKSKVGNPLAISRAMSVGYFAIGEAGSFDQAGDSVLTYYDEKSDLLAQPFATGLNDIVGLAFSPQRQRLFALDFSVADPEKAGLYKLIADGPSGCTAELVVKLPRPTACAFDKQGNLFITILGDEEDSQGGRLLKISGLDVAPKPKNPTK